MKKRIALLLILVMAISLFAGCGSKDDGEITLKWYARINNEPDSREVFAKASEYVKEKLGVNLDIIPLEDYNSKIGVLNASGEDFDLVYTSSLVNNIYQNVDDGNLLELEELLPKYAPKTWEMLGKDVWDGVTINGHIYGVPNQQIFPRGPGFYIPTQNIELLDFDMNKEYKTIADFEDYFRAIKEKTGSYGYVVSAFGEDGLITEGFEQVLGSNLPAAIRFKDDKLEIVNQYDTEEYREHIALRERWVKEGLTAPMEISASDITKYVKPEGEVVPWLVITGTTAPGAEITMKNNYGLDMTCVGKTEPLLGSYGLMATLAAVNSETRYPEKTVELIELLNTDKYLYNLLVYGIEGKNYTKTGENSIEKSTENPYSQPAWAIGNTFNAYILPGQAEDVYEQTDAINKSAYPSPLLGFVPDRSKIELEITNCSGFIEQYTLGLELGIVDRESQYKEYMSKLKAAGADKIVKELNAQLQEWLKNK